MLIFGLRNVAGAMQRCHAKELFLVRTHVAVIAALMVLTLAYRPLSAGTSMEKHDKSISGPLPAKVSGLGYQPIPTAEPGELIQLETIQFEPGTSRSLSAVPVPMSDFALASKFGSPEAGSHPTTLNLYKVDDRAQGDSFLMAWCGNDGSHACVFSIFNISVDHAGNGGLGLRMHTFLSHQRR
jgi:hypothetical protein